MTALENINNVGGEQQLAPILSEHLRCFCGVVAVGTLHGHIYLLGKLLPPFFELSPHKCRTNTLDTLTTENKEICKDESWQVNRKSRFTLKREFPVDKLFLNWIHIFMDSYIHFSPQIQTAQQLFL